LGRRRRHHRSEDPANGALGALDATVAAGIVRLVGKRKPVSAAAGSSLDAPGALLDSVAAMAATGADYVKIAYRRMRRGRLRARSGAAGQDHQACRGAFRRLRARFGSFAAHGQQRFYRRHARYRQERSRPSSQSYGHRRARWFSSAIAGRIGSWRAWPVRSKRPTCRACCPWSRIISAFAAVCATAACARAKSTRIGQDDPGSHSARGGCRGLAK